MSQRLNLAKKLLNKTVAIIHHIEDDDDKLVVVPNDITLTDQEIEDQVEFQEKWCKHTIIRN